MHWFVIISFAVMAVALAILLADYLFVLMRSMSPLFVRRQDKTTGLQGENSHAHNMPTIIDWLLKLITSSSTEHENIAGDLLEEFEQIASWPSAKLWLYKQVLKSALPLIYKTVKSRLAARFGEQIR